MKIISNFLSIVFLVIIQVSFLSTWPQPVSSINLVLCVVVFLSVMVNFSQGLWFALGCGLLLELFTGSLFGLTVSSLLVTAMAIDFLFNNFFTNKSFYSLLFLGIIGTVGYNIIYLVFSFLVSIFGVTVDLTHIAFWNYFFWQPFFNLLVIGLIYGAYYFSSGRLKSIFMISSDHYNA